MYLEPIGIFIIVIGFICLAKGPAASIPLFLACTLLGAAAAVVLTALGGSNLQPGHFLLLFLGIEIAREPRTLWRGLATLGFPDAGFWLMLVAVYGALVTLITPRLFAGAAYVFIPGIGENGLPTVASVPLGPTNSNITQTVYFLGDFVCFAIIRSYLTLERTRYYIIVGGLICAALNLFFAAVDLITYYTNTAEILSFIRNSSYRMLNDTETSGLKRIVGSFSEASSFAYTTIGLLAFTLRLYLEGVYRRTSSLLTILSLLALVFSTSTTGYVGGAVYLLLQFFLALTATVRRAANINVLAFILIFPLVIAIVISIVLLTPSLTASASDLISNTLFNKLSSDSGVERGAWNRQALAATANTMYFGAGIGSLRASSLLVAVPASIGAIGMALYAIFVARVVMNKSYGEDALSRAARLASRDFCIAQLLAASVAASFIDLGLAFFVFAAVASSKIAPSRETVVSLAGADG